MNKRAARIECDACAKMNKWEEVGMSASASWDWPPVRKTRQRGGRGRIVAGALALCSAVWPAGAWAQTAPPDFYKDKTIELFISSGPGGGYDAYARILARHMGKHIPGNPSIVPKNIEGAGGLRLANILYNTAPKDGTSIGTIYRSAAFEPLFGNKAAQFDATRFTWLGSASSEISLCVAWHTNGVTRFEDMQAKELVVGTTGRGSDSFLFTSIINGVLGSKMRMVAGYRSGNDMNLAMERGEVGGRCGWSWSSIRASNQNWIDEKKVHMLVQIGLGKHPDLPNVPSVMDLAKNAEDEQILRLLFARQTMAYPFLAPPDLPAERAFMLRAAFAAAMQDKDLIADAQKSNLEVMPVSGADVETLVRNVYAAPAPLVARAIELVK
jgi:tripartite-type tricarboxylate transporter receptor subunit TctC